MNTVIAPAFANKASEIEHCVTHFDTYGQVFVKGRRNTIKTYPLGEITVNVKSFRVPPFFNQIAYRFFRKSKARRSYEYANVLLKMGIGTPQPIAYFEHTKALTFKDSYYMSEHLTPDLTFRELTEIPDYPEHEIILRQFTRFTFMLHEKGVEFKDHTPGNTLIKKTGPGQYSFYLVDLNRMTFHTAPMPLEKRILNMAKLTPLTPLIKVMSNEYALLSGEPYDRVFGLLAKHAQHFNSRFHRKRAFKRAIGLRKK